MYDPMYDPMDPDRYKMVRRRRSQPSRTRQCSSCSQRTIPGLWAAPLNIGQTLQRGSSFHAHIHVHIHVHLIVSPSLSVLTVHGSSSAVRATRPAVDRLPPPCSPRGAWQGLDLSFDGRLAGTHCSMLVCSCFSARPALDAPSEAGVCATAHRAVCPMRTAHGSYARLQHEGAHEDIREWWWTAPPWCPIMAGSVAGCFTAPGSTFIATRPPTSPR